MVIVAALGITGGISIGVTYLSTSAGSRVPPGIAAMARCVQPVCVATYQASVEAPVSLRKLRRVGMVPPPMGTAVGCQQPRAPIPGAEVSRIGLRIQANHGSRPDPSTTRPRTHRGSSPRRAWAIDAKPRPAKRVLTDRRGAGHGRRGK